MITSGMLICYSFLILIQIQRQKIKYSFLLVQMCILLLGPDVYHQCIQKVYQREVKNTSTSNSSRYALLDVRKPKFFI